MERGLLGHAIVNGREQLGVGLRALIQRSMARLSGPTHLRLSSVLGWFERDIILSAQGRFEVAATASRPSSR
jgi:hypothetical protein